MAYDSDLLMRVAQNIADDFSMLPEVQGVALSGSVAGGGADAGSDIDLYVYSEPMIPVSKRVEIAGRRSERNALNNQFWETGDEWLELESGVEVDVTYRSLEWIDAQLDRILVRHEASAGYSTCFWYNVLHSRILFDREGRLAQLQKFAQQPYPEPLRRAIIAKNHPILRDLMFSAYIRQIEKAVKRGDLVSVNHRVGAVLASYFDIVFAVNRLPHPGEKRLLRFAEERCEKTPVDMRRDVEAVCRSDQQVVACVDKLIDGLDQLLLAEGLIPIAG